MLGLLVGGSLICFWSLLVAGVWVCIPYIGCIP